MSTGATNLVLALDWASTALTLMVTIFIVKSLVPQNIIFFLKSQQLFVLLRSKLRYNYC